MMKDKCLRYLRVDLSESQMFEMGRELARKHNELGGIDAEFDSVKAKFKDRIAGVELTINTLSRLVSNGYDHRDVECKLLWHTPLQAQVTLVRLDTGEEVEVRAMNAQELQETLPFTEPEEAVDPIDPEVLRDLLGLVGKVVEHDTIVSWTREQMESAEEWAAATYSRASDNNEVTVPPMPEFLADKPADELDTFVNTYVAEHAPTSVATKSKRKDKDPTP